MAAGGRPVPRTLFRAPALDERELSVLAQIEQAKTSLKYQLGEPRKWTGALRRQTFARNLQGSNSIEGYDAALQDAAAIAAGEEPLDTDTETRLALEGYRNAMTYVVQLPDDAQFSYSGQLLKSLHFMMVYSDLSKRPGRWRQGDVYVRREPSGEIVHVGADPEDVPGLMNDVVNVLNTEHEINPMVRAAMAHLNLVMIHPFKDGNGRMARCLQTLVLAQKGTPSPVFNSIEEYLGRNTPAYYEVLAQVGGGSWKPERDARPWLRFVLTAHLRQARTLLRRVRQNEVLWTLVEKRVLGSGLPERSIPAIFDAAFGIGVRNSTYRASVRNDFNEDITESTANRDLQKLVQSELFAPRGEKRGRIYVASPELVAIRKEAVDNSGVPRDDSNPFAVDPVRGVD